MKRLVLIFIVSIAFCCWARGGEADTPINEEIFADIKYTYHLGPSKYGDFDCVGELEIWVNMPTDAVRIVFRKSSPIDRWKDRQPHLLSIIDLGFATYIYDPEVYWDTYFAADVSYDEYGHIKEFTPVYSVNSYIADEDLALLEEQHSTVEEVTGNIVNLRIDNRNLHIETTDAIHLSVVDITGKTIYSGIVNQNSTILLDKVSVPFVIVQYTQNNVTTTKKLLVK